MEMVGEFEGRLEKEEVRKDSRTYCSSKKNNESGFKDQNRN